jgi:hypothetical protein
MEMLRKQLKQPQLWRARLKRMRRLVHEPVGLAERQRRSSPFGAPAATMTPWVLVMATEALVPNSYFLCSLPLATQ